MEDRGKSPESELEQTSSGSRSQGLPTITTEDTDSPVKVAASSEHTDGESDANVLKSRQFVYKELLATEKVYIDDLKTVLHVSKHFHNIIVQSMVMIASLFRVTTMPWTQRKALASPSDSETREASSLEIYQRFINFMKR